MQQGPAAGLLTGVRGSVVPERPIGAWGGGQPVVARHLRLARRSRSTTYLLLHPFFASLDFRYKCRRDDFSFGILEENFGG